MSKENKEVLAKNHEDELVDIAKCLRDTLDTIVEEHPQSNGEVLVAMGIFSSMVLEHIFEQFKGMTAKKAARYTKRWASIVVAEVSGHFAQNKK